MFRGPASQSSSGWSFWPRGFEIFLDERDKIVAVGRSFGVAKYLLAYRAKVRVLVRVIAKNCAAVAFELRL
jgi:hypothetical protein